jgi:DNA-binding CsgD family transcriptional regulator
VARKALATASSDGQGGLTARESQVLRLIADGATTREVSEQLFISAKTAGNHIQHIYTKLGVTNRAEATRWAIDHDVLGSSDTDEG